MAIITRPGTPEYEESWERVFGKKKIVKEFFDAFDEFQKVVEKDSEDNKGGDRLRRGKEELNCMTRCYWAGKTNSKRQMQTHLFPLSHLLMVTWAV